MKKICMIILMAVMFMIVLPAKSFLKPGTTDTVETVKDPTVRAFFDFTPDLYDFHVFGFTNTINENPAMSFASLAEVILRKNPQKNNPSDPDEWISDKDAFYFSYSFTGKTQYEVKMKGTDLNLMKGANKNNYFSTVTTVTYPVGYVPAGVTPNKNNEPHTASTKSTKRNYNELILLPRTTNDVLKYFGHYGSLQLNISALHKGSKGPDPVGYSGEFTLTCTSY